MYQHDMILSHYSLDSMSKLTNRVRLGSYDEEDGTHLVSPGETLCELWHIPRTPILKERLKG